MTKKDFITGLEFSLPELQKIIALALEYKAGKNIPKHHDKIITLLFANPSLRTRLSFESGMKKMSAGVNVVATNDSWEFEYKNGVVMNGASQEHIKEAARVIARYSDVIGLRKSDLMTRSANQTLNSSWEDLREDLPIKQLAKYSPKPVVNLESNMFHPCQSMADMMTMIEHFGEVKKKKHTLTWAPHPKPLPLATPHSQFLTPVIFGMDVTLACPPGFELDSEVLDTARKQAALSGGSVTVTHDQKKAFVEADVVTAKSWASLKFFGDWEREKIHREKFNDWTVDSQKMTLTDNAIFMHCLPVRRNVVVTDEVLDSAQSVIIDEAENRMWVQMAIITFLLN